MTDFEVAVLDMAGTTVRDDGLVEEAFVAAIHAIGGVPEERLPAMLAHVRETMGESKIVVFGRLLAGDRQRAEQANAAFEQAYGERVSHGGAKSIDGAVETFARLRAAGLKVALTTGFSPVTQALIIDSLGWRDRVDLWLAPADAGRGRPYPDLALTALLRLGASAVQALAVVGDTAADVQCGQRAGAGLVAGVLTGAHDEATLRAAGAGEILASIADLPGLLNI